MELYDFYVIDEFDLILIKWSQWGLRSDEATLSMIDKNSLFENVKRAFLCFLNYTLPSHTTSKEGLKKKFIKCNYSTEITIIVVSLYCQYTDRWNRYNVAF
jgi:hypothetical protein